MYRRFLIRHLGIYYMLTASLLFAVTGAFAKLLSGDMSSIEVVFFRNFIGFILIIISVFRHPIHQKGGHFFLLIFRGVIGALALLAFFYNIAHISLGAAFTFSKTSPIFTAIFAAIILKDRLSSKGWFAIFLGFLGILCIVQPNLGLDKSDYIGIFSGIGSAMAYTSIRELRKFYDTKIIVLSFMGFGTIVPLLFMILSEFFYIPDLDFIMSKFVMPTPIGWVYIAFMGICGTWFQIYMTKAYAASRKVGVVATVSYADVIFSTIIGIFLGDALPGFLATCGIILVILGGVLVVREK